MPELEEKNDGVIKLILVIFIGYFVFLIIGNLIPEFLGLTGGDQTISQVLLSDSITNTFLGFYCLAIIPLYLIRSSITYKFTDYFNEIKFFSMNRRLFWIYLLVGLLAMWLSHHLPNLISNVWEIRDVEDTVDIAVGASLTIWEEVIFRGVVFWLVSRKYGVRNGIIVSSVLFGLVHFLNFVLFNRGLVATFAQVLWATLFGFFLVIALIRSNSLILPILLHYANNGIIAITKYFPYFEGEETIVDFIAPILLLGLIPLVLLLGTDRLLVKYLNIEPLATYLSPQ